MSAPGFTGSPLDRADAVRHDADAFAAAASDWRARLLKLDGLMPEVAPDGRLVWTTLADAAEDAVLVLLGLIDGRPHFAAWRPGQAKGPATPMRSPAMTAALSLLRPEEASTYAAARSVLDWHDRHRFCANCGTPTDVIKAGWARKCGQCGAEHFPRVDPVVIMIADHDGRALLGRGKNWPAGRYSALAGFLEPGESIEEAVAREIREEAGVAVDRVRYVASQPWPFPSSLMIACIGEAANDVLTVDHNELEDAIWVSRDEVRRVLAGEEGSFIAPPPYAIAFTLLTEWAAG
ncbi:NAD(+) diphosphatase [Sphingomonas bacterium]|uniref:NAD(+) diphosphatase n=1 Tax=Sphingomonas bacterium TaxID=1895847 RepID=UPI0015758AF5|nr:NAD(+) diphosphatase [Sphingomonas bacterium]